MFSKILGSSPKDYELKTFLIQAVPADPSELCLLAGVPVQTNGDRNLVKPSFRLEAASLVVAVSCICLSHLWSNDSTEALCHQGHMKALTPEKGLVVTQPVGPGVEC
ncbi:hypothetical protein KUCAC02_021142 [Chaenocephalus aceratus]|uniref:Uncharacterized protein n=1 Tax=Chaenocephalus aceratus TaxID=36190 RepID=A0ACB9XFV2_CHAAC|nr:hypothetical protein KUCAC02_021142 [Chaenocephalus aceratus]